MATINACQRYLFDFKKVASVPRFAIPNKIMTRYFYEEAGMYIDWAQLESLPEIDTFIDVGVGSEGLPIYMKNLKART